jgi:primosomal protein N''
MLTLNARFDLRLFSRKAIVFLVLIDEINKTLRRNQVNIEAFFELLLIGWQ